MSAEDKPLLPAERAGKIPGIMWDNLLNKMAHHAYYAKMEMSTHPDSAKAHLDDLEGMVNALKDYIIDGKE